MSDSSFQPTYITVFEEKLIHEKLTPEFLGLWFKMTHDGVDAVTGKRALALALRQSMLNIYQTSNLTEHNAFNHILIQVEKLLQKYQKLNVPNYILSAVLEVLVCELQGYEVEPQEKVPESSEVPDVGRLVHVEKMTHGVVDGEKGV